MKEFLKIVVIGVVVGFFIHAGTKLAERLFGPVQKIETVCVLLPGQPETLCENSSESKEEKVDSKEV